VEPFVFSIFFLFFFFPVPSLSQARFILQQTTWIILKQQSYNWALSQAPLVGLQNFGMLSFFVKVKVVHSLTLHLICSIYICPAKVLTCQSFSTPSIPQRPFI
jgi:hypothetical protein